MQARTLTVAIRAPREAAFRHLADIENLPRWAAAFCERIEIAPRGWLALTVEGELSAEIEADERTGVIDLRLGDAWGCTRLIPLRVVTLPGGQTLVSIVFHQAPGQSDLGYERQCELLGAAMRELDALLPAETGLSCEAGWRVLAS